MTTERIRAPHYGMVVTDATGLWMLVLQRTPDAIDDERLVWWAWNLKNEGRGGWAMNLLLLDPAAFGEVVS